MIALAPKELAGVESSNSTHLGFSDESSWNQNRYRSIGLVTAPRDIVDAATAKCNSLLEESGVREFAWKRLTDAKHKFAALKIVDQVVEFSRLGQLRIDVLIWDTHDARHQIQGRDDTANLARMYYHLMANVMRDRWFPHAIWILNVDERTDMDWKELEECLAGRTRKEREGAQARLIRIATTDKRPPTVCQASSGEHTLIQVADLFAGLGAFSWNATQSHREWVTRQSGQLRLMPQCTDVSVSKSASPKHAVLERLASSRLPDVSLNTADGEGLRTYRPSHPINFWKYTPQGGFDKAPRRNESCPPSPKPTSKPPPLSG